ncbi:hypothetical protein [Chelativorans alearense]|uniref:hypothetical protein n=1 Tax=Chelativorans alearense TaxID=2681495 RepID=UPI001FE55F9F|nr:hypothetical protein [Chelativorans alearense]
MRTFATAMILARAIPGTVETGFPSASATTMNWSRTARTDGRRLRLAAGTALAGILLAAGPAIAQDAAQDNGAAGKVLADSSAPTLPVGENTEAATAADRPSIPFMISVDGETVDKSSEALAPGDPELAEGAEGAARPVDRQRQTDLALSAVDIQVKFDGLEAEPLLNVSTVPTPPTTRPSSSGPRSASSRTGRAIPGPWRSSPSPSTARPTGSCRRPKRPTSPMCCASTTRRAAMTRPCR